MINEISKTPISPNKSGENDNHRKEPASVEKPAESDGPDKRDTVDISGPRPGTGDSGEKPLLPVNDQKSEVVFDDKKGGDKPLNGAEENRKSVESHAEADKAIEAEKSNFVRSDTVASAYGQKESGIGKALNKVV